MQPIARGPTLHKGDARSPDQYNNALTQGEGAVIKI